MTLSHNIRHLVAAAAVLSACSSARPSATGAHGEFASNASLGPAGHAETAIAPRAQEFPLSAVRLLDGPFRHSIEVNKAYLLRLEPDRLLAGFRREAGLPKKAEPYGGWETIPREGRYSLAGQALGHYLSALTMMTCATGDAECARRVGYIVDELDACQRAAGTGILCAFPESKQIFAEIAAGKIKSDHLFNLNGGYVPLYVTHKVMAGLRDAWLLLGNNKARDVLVRMADWLETVIKNLTDAIGAVAIGSVTADSLPWGISRQDFQASNGTHPFALARRSTHRVVLGGGPVQFSCGSVFRHSAKRRNWDGKQPI